MHNARRLARPISSTPFCAGPASRHIPVCHIPAAISSTLQHYIEFRSPSAGQAIHAHITKTGFQPQTNISIKHLILYLKCSSIRYARQVFDQMTDPTVLAYGYMISGYFKQGLDMESLELVCRIRFDEKPY